MIWSDIPEPGDIHISVVLVTDSNTDRTVIRIRNHLPWKYMETDQTTNQSTHRYDFRNGFSDRSLINNAMTMRIK